MTFQKLKLILVNCRIDQKIPIFLWI